LVVFNIPGSGPFIITPQSPLPTMTSRVSIDGSTQPGFAGQPIIQINGAAAGAGVNGITLTAGSSTVRGFVIRGFGGNGIQLQTLGNNLVAGNYIGTNLTGTAANANGFNGVQIIDSPNNVIGGASASSRNVISGNAGEGVRVDGALSTGNTVQGNFI